MTTRIRARLLTALSAAVTATLVLSAVPATAADVPTPAASHRVQVEGETAVALAHAHVRPGEETTLRPFSSNTADVAGVGTSAISGTVVDGADAGVADVEVSAFLVTTDEEGTSYEIAATVATDETGAYRFDDLAAGSYDFFFLPLEREDLAWGWFAGGVSPGAEPVLQVADGESTTLAARVLVAAMQVDGAVVSSRTGGTVDGAQVVLWGSNGPDGEGISSFEPLLAIEIDGAPFSFGQLPPGQYLLDATEAPAGYRGEWWDNALTFEAADLIEQSGWFELALSPVVDLGAVGVRGASATGSTVIATHTAISGTTYRYAWYADGKAISGATSKSYRIPASLEHKRLSVKVTGSRSGYVTSTAVSAPRAKILLTATPRVSGRSAIIVGAGDDRFWPGNTLTANPGEWTTRTSFDYQWYADGKAIAGATSKSYKLKYADRYKRISVKVTGSKSDYGTFSRSSAATNRIAVLSRLSLDTFPRVGERMWPVFFGDEKWTPGAKLILRLYADGRLVATKHLSDTSWFDRIPASWRGKRLRATMTVSKPGFTTHVIYSETSKPVTW